MIPLHHSNSIRYSPARGHTEEGFSEDRLDYGLGPLCLIVRNFQGTGCGQWESDVHIPPVP